MHLLFLLSALALLKDTFATGLDKNMLGIELFQGTAADFESQTLAVIQQLDSSLRESGDVEHVARVAVELHSIIFTDHANQISSVAAPFLRMMLKTASACMTAIRKGASLAASDQFESFTSVLLSMFHGDTFSQDMLDVEGHFDAVSVLTFIYCHMTEDDSPPLQEAAAAKLIQHVDSDALPSLLNAYVEYVRPDIFAIPYAVMTAAVAANSEAAVLFIKSYVHKLQSLDIDRSGPLFDNHHAIVLLAIILMNSSLDGALKATLELCMAGGPRFYRDIDVPLLVLYATEIIYGQKVEAVPTMLNLMLVDEFFQQVQTRELDEAVKKRLQHVLLVFSIDHADAYANRQRSLNDASRRFLQEHDDNFDVRKAKETATLALTLAQGLNPIMSGEDLPAWENAVKSMMQLMKIDFTVIVDLHAKRIVGLVYKFFKSIHELAFPRDGSWRLRLERLKGSLAASCFVLQHADMVTSDISSFCESHILLSCAFMELCDERGISNPSLSISTIKERCVAAGAFIMAGLKSKTFTLPRQELCVVFATLYKCNDSFACDFAVAWILSEPKNSRYCSHLALFFVEMDFTPSNAFTRILADLLTRKQANPAAVDNGTLFHVLNFCCLGKFISRTILLISLKVLKSHLSSAEIEFLRNCYENGMSNLGRSHTVSL